MLRRCDMKPYQNHAVDLLARGTSQAVWAGMGTGKSVMTLTHLLTRKRTLVLSPRLVAETVWPEETKKWEHLRGLKCVFVDSDLKGFEEKADVYSLCVNNLPALFETYIRWSGKKWKWARLWDFDTVVVDEASYFKDPTGVWCKDLVRIAHHTNCQVIELTGTPSPNGLTDLWAQIYVLDRGKRLGTGITAYRARWFHPEATIEVKGRTVVSRWAPNEGAREEIFEALKDIAVSMSAEE